jgi:hypothetical protein
VRFFQSQPASSGQHVLAVCRQSWNQSGQIVAEGDEHFARAGLAALRHQALSDPGQYRYHGRDCLRQPTRGAQGHNTKHRGKKGLRPILCFIEETREYLIGKLRKGTTVSGKETAAFIGSIKAHLPGCVQTVVLRADGEFLSWQSVEAAMKAGFRFIIANKGCDPPFDPGKWYRPFKRQDVEYNSCFYQPGGWGCVCRFVAMRIPKEKKKGCKQAIQCMLFEDDNYTYRIFCTDLAGKAHEAISEYDQRADVENLVGEAKREGLEMIPSAKFKNNYAFFQIVMLAYNIWRYMKMIAQQSQPKDQSESSEVRSGVLKGIVENTIRIARLKLLFIL